MFEVTWNLLELCFGVSSPQSIPVQHAKPQPRRQSPNQSHAQALCQRVGFRLHLDGEAT